VLKTKLLLRKKKLYISQKRCILGTKLLKNTWGGIIIFCTGIYKLKLNGYYSCNFQPNFNTRKLLQTLPAYSNTNYVYTNEAWYTAKVRVRVRI